MEPKEENNIRWDKLEEQLDQPSIDPDQSGLTGEERGVLLFFKRLRARLRPLDPEQSFPVEAGWDHLKQRIGASGDARATTVRFFSRRFAAAAAILLLLAAGAFWWLASERRALPAAGIAGNKDSVQRADLPPSGDVQLVLADGQKLSLGQKQSITEKNGVAIHATEGKLEYAKSDNRSSELLYNTLIVPRGKKTQVVLPDGTKVWVNAASSLRYPVAFTGRSREVTIEGEAYFDVKKDEEKPFIVHSRNADVEVLGTAFNVNAYETETLTTLEKGKVSVKAKAGSLILAPGEQAATEDRSGLLKKTPVYTRLYTGWKDGELYLEDLSLGRIADQLSRSYDYEFEFTDASLKELHFTVDMAAPDNLQAVLDHISNTTEGLKFTVSGRVVQVSK
ncbi:MAG: FecR domain-containing protein [Chitinophagaceae bacterium]|nr:FecR domain-containing protein [Chitinophagaceae bacterium]